MLRTRRASLRHTDRVLARGVLLLLLAVFTATFTGMPDSVDGEASFQTTSALWRDGSFAVAGTPEAEGLVEQAVLREDRPGAFPVREGVDGGYYAWFGVGQALLALPLYGAGRALERALPWAEELHGQDTWLGYGRSEYFAHLFVGWRNALLTALTGWLLVLSARRMGLSRRAAFLTGLTYGLSTFAWPQARSWLSDVQATFLLFAGLHLLLRLHEERALGAARTRTLVLFGLAAGGAVLTRFVLAPAVLVLDAIALLLILRRPAAGAPAEGPPRPSRPALVPLALALAPQVLCAAVFLVTNELRFGDPFESGYGPVYASGQLFGYPPLQGLVGLLVSPGKGLLWMAPGLVLLVWGVPHAVHGGQRVWALATLGVLLAVLLPTVAIQGWHGAWTYGPRYLLPALPFLWLGVAHGIARALESPRLAKLAVGLSLLGLTVQVPAVLVDSATWHELALQAAPLRWEAPDDVEPAQRDAWLLERAHFSWSFAQPWAQWRILRHRTAGMGEDFPVREVFHVDSPARVHATDPRARGFRHLAWVDWVERLGGEPWAAAAVVVLMLGVGLVQVVRGLDPGAA